MSLASRRFVTALACTLLCAASVAEAATVYVAGDSTAANGREGALGWGRYLGEFFGPENAEVVNLARGGRSSRTFITEGLWESLRTKLRAGDIVLIQFGHNDGGPINDPRRARGSIRGLGEETEEIDNEQTGKHEVVRTYGSYLRQMIAETREAGATPVLVTLTVRNIWRDGKVERGSGRYSQWTRELAESENTPLIDLTEIAADRYEGFGKEKVADFFPVDHVHTGEEGARLNAQMVVEGFRGLRIEEWRPLLSLEGRRLTKAEPKYVRIAGVRPGSDELRRRLFLNESERADDSLPTLWLIGDSTVRCGRARGEGGQFGWGDPLENAFDQTKINVVNRALGGTGARTFRAGGFWAPVLEQIEPGDFVLIQFGHNDNGQRGALRGVGEEVEERTDDEGQTEVVKSFGAYLRDFVSEIRAREATPILCSLIPRKAWDGDQVRRYDDGHAAWARQVAAEEDVCFIDLYERIAQRYDAMGPDAVEPMFADKHTHTSYEGAVLNAECVLEGLADLPGAPLQGFLRED